MERRRLADILVNQSCAVNKQLGDEPSPLHFRFKAAFAMLKGSLKCLRYGNGKSGYGGDTPCSVSGCAKSWGSLKRINARQQRGTALRNFHLRKRFNHVVHGFHAHKEVFQLGERQGGCAVAFGLAGVGVAFQKQAR